MPVEDALVQDSSQAAGRPQLGVRWRQVPILRQTVEENTGGAVVWDYHVIAVERVRGTSRVYDLTRYDARDRLLS